MSNDSDSEFLNCLNDCIEKNNEIIQCLKKELNWINGHQDRCRAVKTAGTTASVAGAGIVIGSLILAPFTGGASIVAAAGYGTAVGAVGAATNLVTDLTDMITTRIVKSGVEDICNRRLKKFECLSVYFKEINRRANILIDQDCYSVEDSLAIAIGTVKVGVSISKRKSDILQISKSIKFGRNMMGASLRNGGLVWKGMRIQSETLMKAFKNFHQFTKSSAMAVVRTGTILINGVFVVLDVYSLVQDLKNDHPTATFISEIIEQIKNENNELQLLADFASETSI